MGWTSRQARNEYQRRYRREVLGLQPRVVRPSTACRRCGSPAWKRGQPYCGRACCEADRYERFVAGWLAGLIAPRDRTGLGRVSRHIRRWLLEQHGERCQACGWAERSPFTRKVPLTVDHVDGDCDNNQRENLRLLCPNCHALTATFAVLNHGRSKRRRKGAGVVVPSPCMACREGRQFEPAQLAAFPSSPKQEVGRSNRPGCTELSRV